jgi:alpha-L-fucosidase 2
MVWAMIKKRKIFNKGCLPISLALLLVALVSQAIEARMEVDWPKFLARHDLLWETLPTKWESGAFIGNGLLGAMIYSDGTNVLQWDVGRSDVIDHGDRIAIGRFALVPEGRTGGGTMRLDLWNAEARGVLRTEQALSSASLVEWRSFTHANRLLNVIELSEAGDQTARIVFQHLPAYPTRAEYRKETVPEDKLNPEASFGKTDDVNWCLQSFKAGGGYAVAWGEKKVSPRRRLFFWTVDFAPTGEASV